MIEFRNEEFFKALDRLHSWSVEHDDPHLRNILETIRAITHRLQEIAAIRRQRDDDDSERIRALLRVAERRLKQIEGGETA
jgi:hypothetical protein